MTSEMVSAGILSALVSTGHLPSEKKEFFPTLCHCAADKSYSVVTICAIKNVWCRHVFRSLH